MLPRHEPRLLPAAFADNLKQLFPADQASAMLDALAGEPSVSVRVNVARGMKVPPSATRVPWWQGGFYCKGRPAFTFDPLWHAGAYYVQDASSMFIAHVLRALVDKPVCYLDLCAAPGGKTTAALDALPRGSLVVANEVVPARARVLCDNVNRWGHVSTLVASDQPARWGRVGPMFDIVAADVPCSGEGMMRKDAEAVAQWSPDLVEQCARRQRAILDDVWPALKPGGLLVYSTCTFNRDENEAVVEYLMDRHGAQPVAVPVDPLWHIAPGVATSVPCYRFLPHLVRGEGLFMAVLRKPTDSAARGTKPVARRGTLHAARIDEVRSWIAPEVDVALDVVDDRVMAMPRQWQDETAAIARAVNVLQAGTAVAVSKGRKWQPDHAWALSMARRDGAFATVDIDRASAIHYLQGNSLVVDGPAQGWTLVTCQGLPLGWVNNLGSRANNHYPRPLRILSTHVPEDCHCPLGGQ